MKINSFKQGAFIATFSIILIKIMGALYVIPFYEIIGEQGGALYGYAYSIYGAFLSISTVGIPLAMSKLISEYKSLGYNYLKEEAYKIGKYIVLGMSIIAFILLIVFADSFANMIIGDIVGGNTKEDVAFVIRVIATAILLVPLQSVTRGYLQGHKFISVPSYSQIVEQVVRVVVILLGSFLALKVFGLSITEAVGVAVFGATAGAIISYLYLVFKISKNKKELDRNAGITLEEKKVTRKEIAKKIIIYSFPFIAVSLSRGAYDLINTLFSIRVMVNMLDYNMVDAEAILSVFNVWGSKLNIIVISLSIGMVVNLIPNISASYIKKGYEEVRQKINLSYEMLLYFIVPMTFGLSLLALEVWNLFYGSDSLWGPLVFSYSIFMALFASLYTVTLSILQAMNKLKVVVISIVSGLLVKVLLMIPLMVVFENFGSYAFLGIVISTSLAYLTAILINVIYLKKEFELKLKPLLLKTTRMILGAICFVLFFVLLEKYLFINITGIMKIVIYTVVGALIYFGITFNIAKEIFGEEIFNKIKNLFKRGKVK